MSAPIHVNETILAPVLEYLFQPLIWLISLGKKRRARPRPSQFRVPPSRPLQSVMSRERPLTAPLLQPNSRKTTQQTFLQGQSLVLTKVPFDLRILIWEYCLGGMTLHVGILHDSLESRLSHVRCKTPETGLFSDKHACWDIPDSQRNLVSLLLSCHQVYLEAIDVLYSCNRFDVRYEDSIRSLPRYILPQRLNKIRVMHLAWHVPLIPYEDELNENKVWLEIWQVVASMQGLRKLHVHLISQHNSRDYWKDWFLNDIEDFTLLGPVQAVTKPDVFELVLPFDNQVYSLRNRRHVARPLATSGQP